jgi:hypothetical protein
LNQESFNHLNRSIVSNEIETVVLSLPKTKGSGPDRLDDEFHQTFKGRTNTNVPQIIL